MRCLANDIRNKENSSRDRYLYELTNLLGGESETVYELLLLQQPIAAQLFE